MSPRTAKQFSEMREQSREKILQAALKLFAENGFFATSIQDIAKEAGVSKGLMYNYFEKKEDLLYAIIDNINQEGEVMLGKVTQLTTPYEKLKFVIDLNFEYLNNRLEFMKLMTSLALQLDHFPDITSDWIARRSAVMPYFESILIGLGFENPKEEALILNSLLDGVGLQYMFFGNKSLLDELEQVVRRRYLEPFSPSSLSPTNT